MRWPFCVLYWWLVFLADREKDLIRLLVGQPTSCISRVTTFERTADAERSWNHCCCCSVYEVETSFLRSTEYIIFIFQLLINDRQRNNK